MIYAIVIATVVFCLVMRELDHRAATRAATTNWKIEALATEIAGLRSERATTQAVAVLKTPEKSGSRLIAPAPTVERESVEPGTMVWTPKGG